MTQRQWAPSRGTGWAMLISLIATLFVTLTVNVQIYTARWKFAAFYPDLSAMRARTISESIADPRIGEPFAIWLLLSAVALFVGVVLVSVPALRELQRHGRASQRVVGLTWLLVALQALASVGMVVLSQYRFPEFRDQHMAGSYVFFFSQAFAIVTGEVLSRSYAAMGPDGTVVGRVWSPRFGRWRRGYVWVPIVLGVVYLCLFLGKGYAPEAYRYEVYAAYASTELLLLSGFLFYVTSYVPDMWCAWRGSRGAYGAVISSSAAS